MIEIIPAEQKRAEQDQKRLELIHEKFRHRYREIDKLIREAEGVRHITYRLPLTILELHQDFDFPLYKAGYRVKPGRIYKDSREIDLIISWQ